MKHTPYDGSSKPFTIGLTQLDPDSWIEPDDQLQHYLDQKAQLLARSRGAVFVAEDGTQDAQHELLQTLSEYLPARYPDIYCRQDSAMMVGDRRVSFSGDDALVIAGSLVQDDLAIMLRSDRGWRLGAAYIAFPSSWSLAEKFGRTMDEIHAPVPGFEHGTRNADLIARMFDNLPPGRFVERFNWAVNVDGSLHLPKSKSEAVSAAAIDLTEESAFIRIERQTLRKLPETGAIVFTIRIYSDPLALLRQRPDAAPLALSFAEQLRALDLPQAAYKGLVSKRDALISALVSIAG